MKIKKTLFFGLLITAFAFSQAFTFSHTENYKRVRAEEDSRIVTLDTNSDLVAGYGYSATCYISYLGNLSALNISIYYNNDIVEVSDYYNSVACSIYDSSNKNSAVNFSYIFDGNGSEDPSRQGP